MEMMTFMGIPVAALAIVALLAYYANMVWKEWRQDRAFIKDLDEKLKKFIEDHEWRPHMVKGVNCQGEWVRKDGHRRRTPGCLR